MCIRPTKLQIKGGQSVEVACRKCWQCIANRVNDWVGRCIAECETARAAHSVTLTYGRDENGNEDHERAAVLTYSDVQRYFKLLRRHGYPCRYFAVGEYGSTKGRAHWHVMIFWQEKAPKHLLRESFAERHWPHGHSFWDEPSPEAIRYVCKYITKDMSRDERQGHLAMSKKPPLGAEYFHQLAGRYVEQGLAPQEPFYSFAHVRDVNGEVIKFYLKGASLDLFCQSYVDQWAAKRGGHPPHSDMINEYLDRKATVPHVFTVEPFAPRHSRPWIDPPGGVPLQWSEALNSYFCVVDGERLFWSFDKQGNRAWQNVIKTDPDSLPGRWLKDRTHYKGRAV